MKESGEAEDEIGKPVQAQHRSSFVSEVELAVRAVLDLQEGFGLSSGHGHV